MIRRYQKADEIPTAEIWHRAGLDEYTYLPEFQALSEAEARRVFREVIAASCDIWLETSDSVIRGYIAMKGSYIDRLYVDPAHQRQGIGAELILHAKNQVPTGLELHTHQQNGRARPFYEKLGFRAVKYGISPAPESVPDVEYQWRP